MNGRILELAKNPELFQINDLELLNSEINKHPYIQSLRALHLLGTHRLKPENYSNELSITAAYTTDKKILYQLINAVKETEQSIKSVSKSVEAEEISVEEPYNKFTEIESVVVETPKPVFVNGELNRILFEGEEDFLEREDEIIDLESTIESGTIVTQKSDSETIKAKKPEFSETKDAESFSKERIVKEEIISEEKPVIENPTELSFHETEAFLPEVKVEANVEDTEVKKVQEFTESTDAETFSKETIIKEEIISEKKPVIENPTELSFHETEAFLPEVKVEANVEKSETKEFTESTDAETFSKETIVEAEIISKEKPVIENPAELSFHETEAFLPEVKVEANVEDTEAKKVQEFTESTDAETFSKETIIEEEIISEEKPIIEDSSKVSFHATAEFLPEVKIVANPEKAEVQENPKPALNKHEEEMKRLIAEVEAKMKASKKPKETSDKKEEPPKSAEVNFSETQSFDIPKTEEKETEIAEVQTIEVKEVLAKEKPIIEEKAEIQPTEVPQKSIEVKADSVQEKKPDWKPMSFSSNTPDALISKKQDETPVEKEEVKTEKIDIVKEDKTEPVKEEPKSAERPVFNASFFTQNVSALNKNKEETKPIIKEDKPAEIIEASNVPEFINTWQSWLKIDRNKDEVKQKIEISITEIKNKVIENFIEKEPRISKLKEESDFVIKEKNDDISHLMTETLANLYTEQKLYAKAIKSYGILSEKHPEKKTHFDDKIKEVKELRQNK